MKTNSLLALSFLIGAANFAARAQTVVSITATDDTAAETVASAPANPGGIRITRAGSIAGPLTVWVKVSGTAAQGLDYTFGNTIGGVVTIPAGSASLDIPVNVRDDAFIETTETVRVDLEDETGSGASVPYSISGDDRAEIDILDNENPNLPPRAVVSAAAVTSQILESASNAAVFRITREGNINVALQVTYALGGSATPEEDYAVPSGTIALPAGATFAEVRIATINDTLVESPETITLHLLAHPNAGDATPPADAYALGFVTNAVITLLSEDIPRPPVVTITSPVTGGSQPAPGTIDVSFRAVDASGHITRYVLTDGASVIASNLVSHPSTPAPGTPFESSITITNVRAGLHVFRARVWSSTGQSTTSASVQSVVTNIPPIYPKMSVVAVDSESAEGLTDGAPNAAVFAITVDAPMPTPQYVVYRLSSPGPGFDFDFPSGYSATN